MERMDRRGLISVLGTLKTGEGQMGPQVSGEKLMFSVLETKSQDIACWWWGVWFSSV